MGQWMGQCFCGQKIIQQSSFPGLQVWRVAQLMAPPDVHQYLLGCWYRSSQQFQLIQTISNKCSQCFLSKYPSLLSMWVDPTQNLATKTLQKLCWHRTGPGQQEKKHAFIGETLCQTNVPVEQHLRWDPFCQCPRNWTPLKEPPKNWQTKPFLFLNPLPRHLPFLQLLLNFSLWKSFFLSYLLEPFEPVVILKLLLIESLQCTGAYAEKFGGKLLWSVWYMVL